MWEYQMTALTAAGLRCELTGRRTAAMVPGSELRVYEGAAHGLFFTHAERVNADILEFVKA
jgi:pimeloyl-ACP methyl ester carboxylesterase